MRLRMDWQRVIAGVSLLAVLLGGCAQQSSGTNCVGQIKGNINSKGEWIYHMPGQRYYSRTDPEKWFCAEEEAKKAGFRRSKV